MDGLVWVCVCVNQALHHYMGANRKKINDYAVVMIFCLSLLWYYQNFWELMMFWWLSHSNAVNADGKSCKTILKPILSQTIRNYTYHGSDKNFTWFTFHNYIKIFIYFTKLYPFNITNKAFKCIYYQRAILNKMRVLKILTSKNSTKFTFIRPPFSLFLCFVHLKFFRLF